MRENRNIIMKDVIFFPNVVPERESRIKFNAIITQITTLLSL